MIKKNDCVRGVVVLDLETEKEYHLQAHGVINATGPYTDSIRKMDEPDAQNIIIPSQGVHLVLDKSFLPGESAIMVPHTDDGRVLFAIPWHDCVIVGTTDTPIQHISLDPQPFRDEIDFLLDKYKKNQNGLLKLKKLVQDKISFFENYNEIDNYEKNNNYREYHYVCTQEMMFDSKYW